MPDYDTGRDIVEDMLSRAGELNFDQAELIEEARRYANRGYFAVVRSFPWLYSEGYPPITVATFAKLPVVATIATGLSGVTTVGGLPPNAAGAKLVMDRDNVPIRISTVASNSADLVAPYPFPDIVDGTGYIYQDEYKLTDVLVASRIKNLSQPYSKIAIIGYEELDATMPLSIPFGPISLASFYNEDYLRLAMIPETPEVLEIYYSKRPPKLTFSGNPADDTPILPHDERWLVADYSLYFLMKDHGDSRAEEIAQVVAGRITEAKDRQLSKMSPRVWLPDPFSINVRG